MVIEGLIAYDPTVLSNITTGIKSLFGVSAKSTVATKSTIITEPAIAAAAKSSHHLTTHSNVVTDPSTITTQSTIATKSIQPNSGSYQVPISSNDFGVNVTHNGGSNYSVDGHLSNGQIDVHGGVSHNGVHHSQHHHSHHGHHMTYDGSVEFPMGGGHGSVGIHVGGGNFGIEIGGRF